MLAAHIDPGTDTASRRPETIQRSVGWIVETLGLETGGFTIQSLWSDLIGAPYEPAGDWIGIIANKA